MTEKKKEITERLEREFDVCDKHILRINEALEGLGVNIPMSADCYSNLTTEQVRCIDQFIFRFSKLQDSMGAKIFRYILEYLDEDITTLPMRDILNRLERYLIIPSADEWTYIRELRNEIDHSNGNADEDGKLYITDYSRQRVTGGVTLSFGKAFQADLRLNYEKYFYDKLSLAKESEQDKFVMELMVRF